MKLWIDDERPAPEGFIWVKDIESLIALINCCEIDEISFDYYLGCEERDGQVLDKPDGLMCARAVCDYARRKKIKRLKWDVHSTHPDAYKISDMLRRADRFWDKN